MILYRKKGKPWHFEWDCGDDAYVFSWWRAGKCYYYRIALAFSPGIQIQRRFVEDGEYVWRNATRQVKAWWLALDHGKYFFT